VTALKAGRYQLLDHWRGAACLAVLVFHASGRQPDDGEVLHELIARLWIGVPIFFVISGYCITASVMRTRDRGRSLVGYFRRRLRRIFPPYWTAMLLVLVVSYATAAVGWTSVFSHTYDGFAPIEPYSMSRWQWLGTVTLTEGWRAHLLPFGGRGWFFDHAWTLGYEEQFYVVAGVMLLVAARQWFTAAGLVTLGVLVIAALVPANAIGGFWFNGRWVTFACGIAVYYCLHAATRKTRRIVVAALMLALAWACTRPGFGSEGMVTETAAGAFVGLLLVPLYRFDARWTQLAALRPLQWCGRRCYSLYLLHWPVVKVVWWGLAVAGASAAPEIGLLSVPLTLIFSLAAATVFFNYVERPFLSPASVHVVDDEHRLVVGRHVPAGVAGVDNLRGLQRNVGGAL
jgi:peptidoglycan/LPS O-acetylase OafA/YrhL